MAGRHDDLLKTADKYQIGQANGLTASRWAREARNTVLQLPHDALTPHELVASANDRVGPGTAFLAMALGEAGWRQ